MYSESDIDNAVVAGAISAEAAAALRDHVAAQRHAPAVDEEHFRLLTGFNDIFVAIALVLLLVAVGQIGAQVTSLVSGAFVAAAAWMLAEYFTARRRMALPSILLLVAFVGGVAMTLFVIANLVVQGGSDQVEALKSAGIAAGSAAAAWLHWRRFMVPITVAAGAASVVALVMALAAAAVPQARNAMWLVLFCAGLAVFALAMWWDLSNRDRTTRRSDVAFWLHLAAAPMIAHPVFRLLGVFDGRIGPATALAVLVLYIVFALIALAIDRRALLVSGLVYVLYAMYALFERAGAVELSAALTAFVIGSALLMLSAFWQPMRRQVVRRLGAAGDALPPVQILPPVSPR